MYGSNWSDEPAEDAAALAKLLDLSDPVVVFTVLDDCWEVHVRRHDEANLVWAILVETRSEQLPRVIATWPAPASRHWIDFLAEGNQRLGKLGRRVSTPLTELLGQPLPVITITAQGASWEVHLRPGIEDDLVSVSLSRVRPGQPQQSVAYWPAPISSGWGKFICDAYWHISGVAAVARPEPEPEGLDD